MEVNGKVVIILIILVIFFWYVFKRKFQVWKDKRFKTRYGVRAWRRKI